jgi:hypothetical protein
MRVLTKNQRAQLVRKLIANAGGSKGDAAILSQFTDKALLSLTGNARRRVGNEGTDPNEAAEYDKNEEVTNEDEEMLEEEEVENEDVPPQFEKEEETENEEEDVLEEEETENEEDDMIEEEETENSEDVMGDGSETVDPGKEGTDSVPNANRFKRNSRRTANRRSTNNKRPVGNATQRYLAKAPKEIRELLVNAKRIQDREKSKFVKVIIANSRFKKEFLMKKPVAELREMASLVGNANSFGQEDAMFSTDYSGASPTANRLSAKEQDEILAIPTINWAKASKSQRKA